MKKQRSYAGRVRQSQILTTYGPGAMIDLPDRSVVVGGLSRWRGAPRVVVEPRLAQSVSRLLGASTQLELHAPPVAQDDPEAMPEGVEALLFPLWFVVQIEPETVSRGGRVFLTRPLVHHRSLIRMKAEYQSKAFPVVPVRFVQACAAGHLSDIDWPSFAHGGQRTGCRGPLWLDEGGTGGDFAELFVRCAGCGFEPRKLADAKIEKKATLGQCEGRRPWLGYDNRERGACEHINKLLTRSASNTWFAQSMSALSIPDADGPLRVALDAVYASHLEEADESDLPILLKSKVLAALRPFSLEAIWQAIQRRRQGLTGELRSLKQAEVETLRDAPFEPPQSTLWDDWCARRLPLDHAPEWFTDRFDRVVLVERLRIVTAMVGFSRFEPVMTDLSGELDLQVEPAPLDSELKWLPAVEIRGEGIFLGVRADAIAAWRKRAVDRDEAFARAYDLWRADHPGGSAERPDLAYVMLHALSHALMTTVALECGYATTSLAERIYALPEGYGILIYTASPGSEGTLGGLVEVGRHLHRHVRAALERARLCSSDPVCAQHSPDEPHEQRWLHGAACHACMLIAEPSCEQRNQFIDRALLVPTVESADLAFFD